MVHISDIKKRFRQSIKQGTGEAYLLLKKYPQLNVVKDIVHASTHNLAYDSQCEPSRAVYLYAIICLSEYKEEIVDTMLAELLRRKKGTDDLEQMFGIAVCCVKEGNEAARKIIYKRFEKNLLRGYDYRGNNALITLDGVDGILRIANLIGRILERDPDDWEDGSREDYFQKEHLEIDVYKTLRKAAGKDPYIKIYLDSIRATKRLRAKQVAHVKYTYAYIKELIDAGKQKLVISRAGRYVTDDEVHRLAIDFMKEQDAAKQELYMRVFARRQFPLGYKPLLQLIKANNNTKPQDLVFFTVQALAQFRNKEIRTFAEEQILRPRNGRKFLPLLIANYKKGDGGQLSNIIRLARKQDDLHNVAADVIEIYQANPAKECRKPLEAIYDRLVCSLHREDLVKILSDNKVLSKKIKDEIAYDCFTYDN